MRQPGPFQIEIYDPSGRLVRRILSDATTTGIGAVTWDGRNEAGTRVSAGVYFCRLVAAGETVSERVITLE
jgi:flagellar hook assembly protein FlgD